jgi:hypothetical protein
MKALKRFAVTTGLAGCLLFGGCATPPEPFDYQADNELKPGPGLITGEEGAFTIYGEPAPPKQEEPATEETPAEGQSTP